MGNLVFGIASVLANVLLVIIAYRLYNKEKYDLALLLIVTGGLILRVFVSFDLFLHDWDERYHALVAKNLIEHPFKPMLYTTPLLDYDIQQWASNHVWLHKQPAPLYTMALSMLLFGKNVIALRLPSIILSTLTIFATYRIGQMLFNRKVGFIAAFLCSIHGLIIELTSGRVATDHVDVFFMSFIAFGIYSGLRFAQTRQFTWNIICGIFTGLAILTKWLPALIILPVWYLGIRHYNAFNLKKVALHFITLILAIAIISIPWQLYILDRFPLEAACEFAYNRKHFFEALDPHGQPFYYHFSKMRIIFGEIIYIPVIWLVYITIKSKMKPIYLILVTWIIVPYIFFSFAQTKMQGYLIFTAPAIFILTGHFIDHLTINRGKFKFSWLVSIIIFLLIALPVRYSLERVKPFHMMSRTDPWITEIKKLEGSDHSQKKIIFNTHKPIEIMFHTSMIAYEVIPEVQKVEILQQEGYLIYIDNSYTIPEDKKGVENVVYIKLNSETLN